MNDAQVSFGVTHFSGLELGDARLSRRLPVLVNQLLEHATGTIPEKFSRPADREAFYRLCNAEGVTHASVLTTHFLNTLQLLQQATTYRLVIHDATNLDYSNHKSLKSLGQIGNGGGRGYLVHNSLVVDPKNRNVLGLASQLLHTRITHEGKEPRHIARLRESRESRLWLYGTAKLPANKYVVDVCDRGADSFEFLEHELASGRTFVIRSNYSRVIADESSGSGETTRLQLYARTLPAQAHCQLEVRIPPENRGGSKRKKPRCTRVAKLALSAHTIVIPPPHNRRGNHGRNPLSMSVVRVWEPNPPANCEALEWFLLTNHAVTDPNAMLQVKEWYEARWIIEEYHKAMKTGVGIEKLQFRTEARLQSAIGVLSVVALELLQLREKARQPDADKCRADTIVSKLSIEVLSIRATGTAKPDWSVKQYFLALARLGGYQNRRDSFPGWQILWRAQMKLNILIEGVRIARAQTRGPGRKPAERCAKS
ncbi:MAG: IS4 family transposase [Planctomycetaceae bacterium]